MIYSESAWTTSTPPGEPGGDWSRTGAPPGGTFSTPARVGAEVRATVTGEAARGQGSTFRLRPRWPSADQLDYVNKAATAGLLLVALLALVAFAARNPTGAAAVLVRGAAARAGVR